MKAGDPLVISIEDGRVVLSQATITQIETFDAEQLAQFAASTKMTREELTQARKKWGL